MEDLKEIYGFPIIRENRNIVIHSDCNYPQQSKSCRRLFVSLENIILKTEKVVFPLRLNRWDVVIEPTTKNLKNYYSMIGIMKYIQQYFNRLNNTQTFFKPEVYFTTNNNLPTLVLHFYEISYDGTLNIDDADELSFECMIDIRDIKLTPKRVYELKKHNIDINWFKHIPLLPMEQIKFDKEGSIMKFKHQKLNTQ